MKKREKRERAALLRMRRKSITRRRKKKIYPRPHPKKTHLSSYGLTGQPGNQRPKPIEAPKDFRLLKNTEACISFFKRIRSRENAYRDKWNNLSLYIDLSSIEHIDFASTMMLDAICEELSSSAPVCTVSGSSPRNELCRQYLLDSGFLNNKYDRYGNKFENVGHSVNIKIEHGRTKLKDDDVMSVVEMEKLICKHVTGSEGRMFRHIEMIKEICGNTVDWSEAIHDQWIFGTKFEEGKVIVIALDLGQGILESISRKFSALLTDLLELNSHIQILEGAFDKKYGSKSGKPNRNKGLPSIKYANTKGYIKNLVVITNNVILDFTNSSNSCKFVSNKNRGFNGTLYSWCVDATCYQKTKTK